MLNLAERYPFTISPNHFFVFFKILHFWFFNSALCYCTAELLSSSEHPPSIVCPSVICTHHFLGNHQVDWHQILVTGIYPSYISRPFFFCFSNLKFLIYWDFFSFSLTYIGPYGRKKFQTTSPLKARIRFTPKKSCILLGRVSTKVVQRIVKWNFGFLRIWFSFSLTWHHMGCILLRRVY